MTPTRPDRRTQRGAASLLMLSLVAVAVGLVAAIGVSSPALIDQARADAVADLAALAGVDGGQIAARTVAQRSGASDVRTSVGPDEQVVVSVVVGRRAAVATAAPLGVVPSDEPVGGP